jgi:hypothetical protein
MRRHPITMPDAQIVNDMRQSIIDFGFCFHRRFGFSGRIKSPHYPCTPGHGACHGLAEWWRH